MNRNKNTRRHMSDDLKWVITFLLVIAAVSMVVICAKNGVFHFEAGTVTANDDETVMESEAPEDGDENENSSSKFTVFVTAGNGGTANPAGSINVEAYDSITVNFTPDEGYVVESVTLDGQELGAVESYTLSYIDKNHNIVVTFAEEEIEPEEEEESDTGENEPSGNDKDLNTVITDGVNGIFNMILGE